MQHLSYFFIGFIANIWELVLLHSGYVKYHEKIESFAVILIGKITVYLHLLSRIKYNDLTADTLCSCFVLLFIFAPPRRYLRDAFSPSTPRALSKVRTRLNSRPSRLDAPDDKRPDLVANFLIPFLATNRIVENYCSPRGSFVSARESTCRRLSTSRNLIH